MKADRANEALAASRSVISWHSESLIFCVFLDGDRMDHQEKEILYCVNKIIITLYACHDHRTDR